MAINGWVGSGPRPTNRNYTAGTVRCIGGLCGPGRIVLLDDCFRFAQPTHKLRNLIARKA